MTKSFVPLVLSFILSFAFHLHAAPTKETSIVFLGDSLTEGYGIEKDKAYPKLIEERLKKDGHTQVKVTNAGISGSTTASAPSRLKWLLKSKPDILVLALGANDGLRGVPIETTKSNLEKAIEMAQEQKVKVLLAGMQLPPNYGKTYREGFAKIFPELAKKYKIVLIPFLLQNVAAEEKLNQPDGIHPNEAGHAIMAETIYPYVKKAL